MSFVTMETGGSPSQSSWHQVSLFWWVVTRWGLLLWGHFCTFQRLGPCHSSLLGLCYLAVYVSYVPIVACGLHLSG